MKNINLIILCFFILPLMAQENNTINTNNASFEMGNGLNFNFEDNNYQFAISGFVQPSYAYSKMDGMESENEFNAKRTYLSISGKALKEKVSFFIQNNFSLNDALLDAWVAYHPADNIKITVGQTRTFVNNRELTFDEDKFQFTERSSLSRTFSNTGREFGLFFEGDFMLGNMGFSPQLALTSGDGRNSFGADSRDVDLGGLKYGGRLDLYPLGFFTDGNDVQTADLLHEEEFKIAIGAAASYNDGASNSVGEGHGNFVIYEENGEAQLPDYRQVYADILMKYQGFSLLTEYVNASATGLKQTFVNQAATVALQPQQISSFLVLGDAFNSQIGYVTKKGYSVDLRYSQLMPEFDTFSDSVLQETDIYSIGLTKYIKHNDVKVQTTFSSIDQNDQTSYRAELMFQIVF